MKSPPPLWSVALLSATALAYEVLLTRLFAIIQWHHYAYMIISLALLGYGASGTLLSLLGKLSSRRFAGFFIGNALLFALSAVGGFLLAQRIAFNPLELAWDPGQPGYLSILYLLLAVPFFCVANCFGSALGHYRDQIHRLYAFDLAGAGTGALGIVLLLYAVPPMTALLVLGGLGLGATLLAALECRLRKLLWLLAVAVIGIWAGTSLPESWLTLRPSDYKDLHQALRVLGAEKIAERSSPLGLVDVVRNDRVPFRYAPGLSLVSPADPPLQWGLYSDGDSLGAITRYDGNRDSLAYLDYLTSALPYHLLQRPQVLVLGAGGGTEVLQALYHQASIVDAVELNPQIVALLREDFAAFTGSLYFRPNVRVHIGEARGYLASHPSHYDLIQLSLLDAYGTTSTGLPALSENYLYTVEAMARYLARLNPGGMLAITRWLRLPPRDSLKLFVTAVTVLESAGITDPGQQLALIRGWKTSTLLVKNGLFNSEELASLREFCRTRSFDLAYYPGIKEAETNRYNVLDQNYLYQGALALLGPGRQDFMNRYKFDIRPATDDRPYFFHFLKWRTVPELLSLQARSGLGQLEWGYLILVATLLQALVVSGVLIVLPLWLGQRRAPVSVVTGERWRVLIYFSAIGLGFLFLEIAFIQKFILLLSHPLYSIAVVLCAFLIFAGLGSAYSRRLHRHPHSLPLAVAGIVLFALAYLAGLPPVFQAAAAWPDFARILCTVALIAPLAFCMGMPFPLGLAKLAERHPSLLPWAWAINGCASVVSAVAATLLAVHIGFSGVVISAALLYLLAALTTSCEMGSDPISHHKSHSESVGS